MKPTLVTIFCLFFGICSALGLSKYEVPPKQFLGKWKVEKAFYNPPEGAPKVAIEQKPSELEFLFKKGKKQALYRYSSDSKNTEYGITILEITKTKLVFRSWSAHPANKTIITLKENGTAVVERVYAKGGEVFHLRRQEDPKPAEQAVPPKSDRAGW